MHMLQVNDYVKWEEDGFVWVGRIRSISASGRTATVETWCFEFKRKLVSGLTYLPPLVLNAAEYRDFIRLESYDSALLKDNCGENTVNVDNCPLAVEDAICALRRIRAGKVEKYVCAFWEEHVRGTLFKDEKHEGVYTESDLWERFCNAVYTYLDEDREWGEAYLDKAIAEAEIFLEDREKPFDRRRYPSYIKEWLIDDEDGIDPDKASEEERVLYRLFADELAEQGNYHGLRAVAYSCYGGNAAFACDWKRSEECLLKLFDMTEDAYDRAFFANSLGYIYYYGRVSDAPDYERAYKYFSFAAFNGVEEARYKIADMYTNGYGVVASKATAYHILQELYTETLADIKREDFRFKFADVAWRMGNSLVGSEDENENDYEAALYYYMQADYAIRKQMEKVTLYGDELVAARITDSLAKAKEKTNFKPRARMHCDNLFNLFENMLDRDHKLNLTIHKEDDLTYRLTFTDRHRYSDNTKLFLIVPELDVCGHFSKLVVEYHTETPPDESILDRPLVIDEVTRSEALLHDGEVVLQRENYGDHYTLKRSWFKE